MSVIGVALIAGVISFISPCVLPLVPAYIGYMGGRMTQRVARQPGEHQHLFRERFGFLFTGLFFCVRFQPVFCDLRTADHGCCVVPSLRSVQARVR